jgi:hypothetical protein
MSAVNASSRPAGGKHAALHDDLASPTQEGASIGHSASRDRSLRAIVLLIYRLPLMNGKTMLRCSKA